MRVGTNPVTGVLIRRDTRIHTGRIPPDDRGRAWGYASTSQGTPGTAGNHSEEARKRHGRGSASQPRKETSPLTPDLRLLASKSVRERISIALSHHVCGAVTLENKYR